MPINLQGSGNIAEGWPGPPQLEAPNIGALVHAILSNRLARDKMTQESIADTIKNVREERQSAEYLEQMKAAGLVPEGFDAGGAGGAKYGTALAVAIERKRREDAMEAHRKVMEARVGGRGRGGGGGGGGDGSAAPQTYWDEQGREWRPGPGGRWIPMKPTGGTKAGETDNTKAIKEQGTLVEKMAMLESDRKKQEAADITAGAKDPNYPQKVPFKQSDLYNWTANRLKQLQEIPGMPSTAPDTGRPVASDKAGGHTEDYGVPPVGTIRNGYRFKGGDPKEESNWEPI